MGELKKVPIDQADIPRRWCGHGVLRRPRGNVLLVRDGHGGLYLFSPCLDCQTKRAAGEAVVLDGPSFAMDDWIREAAR